MKLKQIILLSIIGISSSCSDYLDVAPDNIATIDMAFNNKANAEKYLATCYSYMPLYGAQRDNPGLTSGGDVWF